MRNAHRIAVVLLMLLFTVTGGILASGYSIYEQGAEAMANAGAFSARADDPSALFFNPAGIVQLERFQLQVGTTAIFLNSSEFESALTGNSFEQNDNVVFPSTLYFTQEINDDWAWGVAITSPFGLKTEWDSDFEGRYISRKSHLVVVNINPNVAWQLNPQWSVALGIDYAFADMKELSRNINFSPAPDGFTKVSGDGTDLGWNLAARWQGESGWIWGGSYRSKMEPEIEGDVEFENIPPPFASDFPEGGATADLPLPASFATGVAYVKEDDWEAEFDIVWTGWSDFDRLQIDFENNTASLEDVDQFDDWDDTISFRAGFTWHLHEQHEYRVGFYYDQNPIPDEHVRPRLPDADRTSAQLGYGYTSASGRWNIDVAYQALFFDDRVAEGDPLDVNDPVQPGLYENFTSLLGVSVGWRF